MVGRSFSLAATLLLWALSSAALAGALEPYRAEGLEFELKDLEGRSHRLADYRGKVVLVNFWASWCGPCITEIPSLRDLRARMAGRPFEVAAVNYMEGKSKVHRFMGRVDMPFRILLDRDGATFKTWEGQVLPTSFLVDPDGRVRYWVQGPIDWSSPEVVDTIDGLLREGVAPAPLNIGVRLWYLGFDGRSPNTKA